MSWIVELYPGCYIGKFNRTNCITIKRCAVRYSRRQDALASLTRFLRKHGPYETARIVEVEED